MGGGGVKTPVAMRSARSHGVDGIKIWLIWSVKSLDTWHWMPLGCLESIVKFHPTAQVVILSNSMPLDFLDCFRDMGYDVTVRRYNITALVENTFLEKWVTTGKWAQSEKSSNRYAHE